MHWLRRLRDWLYQPATERMAREQVELGRSTLRWTRLMGIVAVIGLLLTGAGVLIAFVTLRYAEHSVGATSPSTPTATVSLLSTLSAEVTSLHAGFTVQYFSQQLHGSPTIEHDLSSDFQGSAGVTELVWALPNREGWVQVLANTQDTVWFWSVVSCDERWTPSFPNTSGMTVGQRITLHQSSFASIDSSGQAYLGYFMGADWVGRWLESDPGGMGATDFHESVWGYVYDCGSTTGGPVDLLNQAQFGLNDDPLIDLSGQDGTLRASVPNLEAFRSEVKPNLYGDFLYFATAIGVDMPHIKNSELLTRTPSVGFDWIGPYVGPDERETDTIMRSR